jgi:CCR4-NOT transcription complex subunit 6
MFSHGSNRQNHSMLNGGAQHHNYGGMGGGLHKAFNSQSHSHQPHHVNNHQEHGGLGGGSGFGNHQHNISAGTLSNTTPHFTPAHLQNGTPDNSGAMTKPHNEQYTENLREYGRLKMAGDKPHFYARTTPHVSRLPGPAISSVNSRLTDADEHGTRTIKSGDENDDQNKLWDAMDLGGHGLRSMSETLFRHYPDLRKIFFNHNRLTLLQPQISTMHQLTHLDLSFNQLTDLPPEIGMLTNLKKLLLYENRLDEIPFEIGYLYQLEMLGLEGNPMRRGSECMDRLVENGTQDLVRYLREEAPREFTLGIVGIMRLTLYRSTNPTRGATMAYTAQQFGSTGEGSIHGCQLEHALRSCGDTSRIWLCRHGCSRMGNEKVHDLG